MRTANGEWNNIQMPTHPAAPEVESLPAAIDEAAAAARWYAERSHRCAAALTRQSYAHE